jgi:glycosyltransferase involved in cell wall biosynthesis
MTNESPERKLTPFKISAKLIPKTSVTKFVIAAVSWRLQRAMRQIRGALRVIRGYLHAIRGYLHAIRAFLGSLQASFLQTLGAVRVFLGESLSPQLWRHSQYEPRNLYIPKSYLSETAPENAPRIGIVTPSYNHAKYLGATIESVLSQAYPNLVYFVQDGGSNDGSLELLQSYGDRLRWRSEPDVGQGDAINRGFAQVDSEIMAYLNSDDTLLPGTLAYVARFFQCHPYVDIVYGHRVNIDQNGQEIARCVLPPHDAEALKWADYIPQETMFWRRRVWDKIGPIDEDLQFALDWDFILRAQAASFNLQRLPRFLACFRIHARQKTTAMMDVGNREMFRLRRVHLGYEPEYSEIEHSIRGYLRRQILFHWLYKCGLLRY